MKKIIMFSGKRSVTPIYAITTSSLGLIENNEAESINNANKLIGGLNTTPDGITVNGVYFMETPATALTATDIRLSSVNSGEFKSNKSLTTLFTSYGIENIEVEGVTFSDIYSGGGDFRLFHSNSENNTSMGVLKFNSNIFEGNIYIYWKRTDNTTNPSTYKINTVTIANNTINNNRKESFHITNIPIDVCNITNNQIHNWDNSVFEFAIGNTHTYMNELYYLRPLFTITDNYAYNDVDWEVTGAISTSGYNTFALIEAQQVDYLRNHVEGIWTTLDKAVYDAYLSCNIVNYKNNTNKNNIKFNIEKYANTLMKSKGSASDYPVPIRNYEDNDFIVEESWIDLVVLEGANKAYSSVNYAETDGNGLTSSIYIKNNTFNVYSFIGRRFSIVHVIDYEVSGNTFNLDYSNNIYTETIYMTDTNVPESVVFNDNIFNVSNTTSIENVPAMVRVIDNRTTNTDKIGSMIINNNTGTLENSLLTGDHDTDNFEMIDNTLDLNPDIATPYFSWQSYNEISKTSNNAITYSTGVYIMGYHKYSATSDIDENITFYGTPSSSTGQRMLLVKGEVSAPDTTYRRTFTVDDGDEIYYFEFTLSYNVGGFWEVSFIDSGDIPRTYRMNNYDGEVGGNGVFVKVVNSGTSNTITTIRFSNSDSLLGFEQRFLANTSIKLNITTLTN